MWCLTDYYSWNKYYEENTGLADQGKHISLYDINELPAWCISLYSRSIRACTLE